MPRGLRIYLPGVSAHVYLRAINRAEIFCTDEDHERFLAVTRWATVASQVDVHAFAIMQTHYHLIATPRSASALPRAMKLINGEYVRYYNRKHDRIGTTWSGRYDAKPLVDQRYFWTCFTYVERNPVEAGIVSAAEDYRWSSYRIHAFGAYSEWLVLHPLYLALGSTPAIRQAAYRAIFHGREALWPADHGV